jgi:glycosyltransferase involved in cell wall biosynthesis
VQGLLVGASHPEGPDRRYEEEVMALIRELDLEDAIAVTGHMAHVADAYAASTIVVNPARIREGARRVMLEALAAGRPIVATRVGAIPEILRDGEDSILIPPDDPDALARACLGLLEDEAAARRLAERGRERVRKDFSEERALARFAEVVTTMTGRTESPAPRAEPAGCA